MLNDFGPSLSLFIELSLYSLGVSVARDLIERVEPKFSPFLETLDPILDSLEYWAILWGEAVENLTGVTISWSFFFFICSSLIAFRALIPSDVTTSLIGLRNFIFKTIEEINKIALENVSKAQSIMEKRIIIIC